MLTDRVRMGNNKYTSILMAIFQDYLYQLLHQYAVIRVAIRLMAKIIFDFRMFYNLDLFVLLLRVICVKLLLNLILFIGHS